MVSYYHNVSKIWRHKLAGGQAIFEWKIHVLSTSFSNKSKACGWHDAKCLFMCYFTCHAHKIPFIDVLTWILILGGYNPTWWLRWWPLVVTSQTSSNATTLKYASFCLVYQLKSGLWPLFRQVRSISNSDLSCRKINNWLTSLDFKKKDYSWLLLLKLKLDFGPFSTCMPHDPKYT